MKLKWFGHSAFLLTSRSGVKVLTDPYHWFFPFIRYKPLKMPVDIITVSHGHFNHSKTFGFPGNPVIIREPQANSPRGIEILGVSSFHDSMEGKKRGRNIIYRIIMDDISFCHLGDLGHILTTSQMGQIGKVDVLMAPVGGVVTADVKTMEIISRQLRPKIIIPMHFRTNKTLLPLKSAEDFLKVWDPTMVQRLDLNELDLRRGDMVKDMNVWLLNHDYKPRKKVKK